MRSRRKVAFPATAFVMLFLLSCNWKATPPRWEIDTPAHHVHSGMQLMESGKLEAAFREFGRAREQDPAQPDPYIGLGLVYGFRGEIQKALESMGTASRLAKEGRDKAAVSIGYMRIYILGKDRLTKDWLQQVEEEYRKALSQDPDSPAAHYYMGQAYKMADRYDQAAIHFIRVMDIDRGYAREARSEYEAIRKFGGAGSVRRK